MRELPTLNGQTLVPTLTLTPYGNKCPYDIGNKCPYDTGNKCPNDTGTKCDKPKHSNPNINLNPNRNPKRGESAKGAIPASGFALSGYGPGGKSAGG